MGFEPPGVGNGALVMRGSTLYSNRLVDLVRLALGPPDAVGVAVRSRSDQVLARLGDALAAGRSPADRFEAIIDTYMLGALQILADAATGDRIVLAEAEMTATAVAAAMDRTVDAAAAGDAETAVAAMAAAESLLDLDIADLYNRLL
jgi:hypothetical protein